MKKIVTYICAIALCFFAFYGTTLAVAVVENLEGGGTVVNSNTDDNVIIVNPSGFCVKASSVIQIVGYVLLVIKIVIPLIIIILASIDFGSAALAGEEKVIKEKAFTLLKRILVGIAIFLLPTIVRVLYFGIYDMNHDKFDNTIRDDSSNCIDCLTNPGGCYVSKDLTVLK